MAKKNKEDKFFDALMEYSLHFGEGFPTFETDYLEEDEIIELIDKCIEENKEVENFIVIPDDDVIL